MKEKVLAGAFYVIVKLQTSRRFVSSSTDHKLPEAGLTIAQLQRNKRSVATKHSHYTDTYKEVTCVILVSPVNLCISCRAGEKNGLGFFLQIQ